MAPTTATATATAAATTEVGSSVLAPSSDSRFLLLVVRPGAPSSVLAPSSDGLLQPGSEEFEGPRMADLLEFLPGVTKAGVVFSPVLLVSGCVKATPTPFKFGPP